MHQRGLNLVVFSLRVSLRGNDGTHRRSLENKRNFSKLYNGRGIYLYDLYDSAIRCLRKNTKTSLGLPSYQD